MPKTHRTTFVICTDTIPDHLGRFLDMLRYDAARVIDYGHRIVVLQTEKQPPTTARWHSMALPILVSVEGDYPDIVYLMAKARERISADPSPRHHHPNAGSSVSR